MQPAAGQYELHAADAASHALSSQLIFPREYDCTLVLGVVGLCASTIHTYVVYLACLQPYNPQAVIEAAKKKNMWANIVEIGHGSPIDPPSTGWCLMETQDMDEMSRLEELSFLDDRVCEEMHKRTFACIYLRLILHESFLKTEWRSL